MAEVVKYLFDRAFEPPAKAGSKGTAAALQMQEEWERKMADACCTAYEEGHAEGEAEARKGFERKTCDQVVALLQCAENLLRNVKQECEGIQSEAIALANMTASLLAKELIEQMPTANLESLFAEALEHANDAPHIVFTVNDNVVDEVQKTITSIAAQRGFLGKIIVLGDPETKAGDCCLQWADGGISVDFEKTRKAISQIVERYLTTPETQAQTAGADQAQSETNIVSGPISGSGEMQ